MDERAAEWSDRRRREFWRTVYATLTPCQQRAYLGHVLEGKRYSQIAREAGVHRSTILRTARRAEARLREVLQPKTETVD